MTSDAQLVSCSTCGTRGRRDDMFGVEPDLQCEACAHGIRKRMQVRVRPAQREHKPIVTIAILVVSVILFVVLERYKSMAPDARPPAWFMALFQWVPIWDGQWWRHFTCMFFHGGLWHIGMNGFALWYIGREVEEAWGSWVLAGLFTATGIGASAIQWWGGGPGIGISGALFGLIGFLWALRLVHPVAARIMNERMRKWILTLLVVGLVLTQLDVVPIGNAAHAGGLAVGFVIGLAARHRLRKLLVPASALLVIGLVLLAQLVRPLDPAMGQLYDAWEQAKQIAEQLEQISGE